MSQQRQPTLADYKLNMVDRRQDAEAATNSYIRELERQLNIQSTQINNQKAEIERLKPKETKKESTK